jgi:aryl-alcohol dehydrogenase-like predicted oxidoreductase
MALCLGTAQLGQDYGIFKKPDREKAIEILEAAIEGGIEYIDTAPMYGEAEDIIGEFLRKRPVIAKVISKVPSYKGKDAKGFIDHCKRFSIESMRKLGRNRLWGVLLHDAQNALDFPNEVMGLRTWYIATGVCQRFGVSLYAPSDIRHRMMGLYQFPLSIMDSRFLSEIPEWDMFWNGNFLMVRSVYLRGKIQEYRRAMAFVRDAIAKKTKHNIVVVGCESVDQVRANVNLYNNAKLEPGEYEEILKASAQPDLAVVDPRRWK